MTPVEKYIKALNNHKKIGGTLDQAIVIAETLLLMVEEKELKAAYNKGYENGQANNIHDAEQYYHEKFKKQIT